MYQLTVEGMTCGHCTASVTKAVQALDAGARVEVDLAKQTVQVETKVALADVTAAVVDAGFPVRQSSGD